MTKSKSYTLTDSQRRLLERIKRESDLYHVAAFTIDLALNEGEYDEMCRRTLNNIREMYVKKL